MPHVETGVEFADVLLHAVHDEAEARGVETHAQAVTPALVSLDDADLGLLAGRGEESPVRYDGRVLWINGVDFSVTP